MQHSLRYREFFQNRDYFKINCNGIVNTATDRFLKHNMRESISIGSIVTYTVQPFQYRTHRFNPGHVHYSILERIIIYISPYITVELIQ